MTLSLEGRQVETDLGEDRPRRPDADPVDVRQVHLGKAPQIVAQLPLATPLDRLLFGRVAVRGSLLPGVPEALAEESLLRWKRGAHHPHQAPPAHLVELPVDRLGV